MFSLLDSITISNGFSAALKINGALLTDHNPSMFRGIGLLASLGNYSLWSKAWKHSYKKLQKMWNKDHWSWKQLFSHGQLVPICAISFLQSSWSHSWPPLWREDWHVVFGLYLGWAMLWGSMSLFASTLFIMFGSVLLIANQMMLSLGSHQLEGIIPLVKNFIHKYSCVHNIYVFIRCSFQMMRL